MIPVGVSFLITEASMFDTNEKSDIPHVCLHTTTLGSKLVYRVYGSRSHDVSIYCCLRLASWAGLWVSCSAHFMSKRQEEQLQWELSEDLCNVDDTAYIHTVYKQPITFQSLSLSSWLLGRERNLLPTCWPPSLQPKYVQLPYYLFCTLVAIWRLF